jgi:phosphoglycerol transferase MdoB-like AlkP superfamily enzyme
MAAETTNNAVGRWAAAFVQHQQTFRAWLLVLMTLLISRVVYLVVLRPYWPVDYPMSDLVKVFGQGIRFDCVTATYVCVIPIVLSSLGVIWGRFMPWAEHARSVAVGCYLAAAPAMLFGSIGYYREYADNFNPFMFEFFYDDTWSILRIMQSEHGLAQNILFSVAISAGVWIIYRRWFQRAFLQTKTSAAIMSSWRGRLGLSLTIVLLLVMGVRCSLGSRPLQAADAGVTSDRFFNKVTMNAVYAFQCAVVDRLKEGSHQAGTKLTGSQVADAVQTTFFEPLAGRDARDESTPNRATDDPLFQVAAGPKTIPPEHIFVILMESYDAWPLLDKYRSLGLVENGHRLAEQGLHIKAFLPSTDNSLGSYLALTSGLNHTSRFRQQEFPTSLPHVFNQLGYATRLFVGDSATWQHIEDLASQEGFSEFYAAGAIVTGGRLGRQPRAHDPELFAFVRRHLRHGKPSINVIRTVSNHGPYEIDLEAEGCALPNLPDDLKTLCNKDEQLVLTRLGHLKFSDRCLGRFVEQVEAEFPNSLFAITGDHYGREFFNNRPTEFEGTCVPLILYGKQVLSGVELPQGVAGSHLDITPTLVNLAAPRGFHFASLGVDLLTPRREFLGISETHAIGQDFIVAFRDTPRIEPLPWTHPDSPGYREADTHLARLSRVFEAFHGLSSWIVQQGEQVSLRNQGSAGQR